MVLVVYVGQRRSLSFRTANQPATSKLSYYRTYKTVTIRNSCITAYPTKQKHPILISPSIIMHSSPLSLYTRSQNSILSSKTKVLIRCMEGMLNATAAAKGTKKEKGWRIRRIFSQFLYEGLPFPLHLLLVRSFHTTRLEINGISIALM